MIARAEKVSVRGMIAVERSNYPGGLLPADPASEMVQLQATGGDVRELQRTLWACAKRSPGSPFSRSV